MATDLDKLRALSAPFTTSEAAVALSWSLGDRALGQQLHALGYSAIVRRRPGDRHSRKLWSMPDAERSREDLDHEAMAACPCRCHTGTCGKNDMVLAERTIRIMEKLRPLDRQMVETIDHLVSRAGVDYAIAAIGVSRFDDEVPF